MFGFPVHIRTGFIAFIALVLFINGSEALELGIWMAVFMTFFTLLHELGHAFAARATGAQAEIALDFLFGYAAFVPTRPLKRWEQAGISFAGPGVQIATGVAGLLAMGINPLDIQEARSTSYASAALWFAGPVIGVFNLIPVLPFDGGNIALMGIDRIAPNRSRALMMYFSLALTVGGAAALVLFADPRWRQLAIYAAIPLAVQLQMIGAAKEDRVVDQDRKQSNQAAQQEALAWQTGQLPEPADEPGTGQPFRATFSPSPWFVANLLLQHGHIDQARDHLLESFANPRLGWTPPDAATERQLEALVDLLPQPLPAGGPQDEFVLTSILLRLGDYSLAAHYAAASYSRRRIAVTAVLVARAAEALGDRTTATAWLNAALAPDPDSRSVRVAIGTAPEFDVFRHERGYAELLGQR